MSEENPQEKVDEAVKAEVKRMEDLGIMFKEREPDAAGIDQLGKDGAEDLTDPEVNPLIPS